MTGHKDTAPKSYYAFTLYISGMNGRSLTAIKNLKAICEEHLPLQYEIKVIDLAFNPERASSDQIIATPTLVKTFPLPTRTLIGDLSNTPDVLIKLGIKQDCK